MRIFILLLMVLSLYGKGTSAGTTIVNIAELNYSIKDHNYTASSNKLIDIVDQKVDTKLICQESDVVIVGEDEEKQALTFQLYNMGNGLSQYLLSPIEGEESLFSVENREIYLDNGDGIFSPATDTLITDINLSADGNTTLFFVGDIPKEATETSSNGIKADALAVEGLAYGEATKKGNYYFVNATHEEDKSDLCTYKVSNLKVLLEKSATLSSDELYHGTTIHYTIEVHFEGTGTVHNLIMSDPIPKDTHYVEGSLQLNGKKAGVFKENSISVPLGDVTIESEDDSPTYRVTFDVKVQ